jgi:hypothetical protein
MELREKKPTTDLRFGGQCMHLYYVCSIPAPCGWLSCSTFLATFYFVHILLPRVK